MLLSVVGVLGAVTALSLSDGKSTTGSVSALPSTCPAADVSSLCTLVPLEAGLEKFWAKAFPSGVATGVRLNLVTGNAPTTCGKATPEDGSFYCPDDATIYIQREDLEGLQGVEGRAEAATLLAHEFGHHVQVGTRDDVDDETTGPASPIVRYELQADCYAGLWIGQASLGIPRGALIDAVRASGDDIGEDPLPADEFAHGSGAQRVAWFVRGLAAQEPEACDTSGAL